MDPNKREFEFQFIVEIETDSEGPNSKNKRRFESAFSTVVKKQSQATDQGGAFVARNFGFRKQKLSKELLAQRVQMYESNRAL